tara:strand:- start:93 stop:380 length:288 start_codon:yes stop_codon:yes gene_type:complete
MGYRKQMTPGMKKCKERYGKSSPYKAADQNLIKGAGDVAQGDIDAVAQSKTGTEKWAKIAQDETAAQMNKYGADPIDPFSGNLTSDEQIKKNLEA